MSGALHRRLKRLEHGPASSPDTRITTVSPASTGLGLDGVGPVGSIGGSGAVVEPFSRSGRLALAAAKVRGKKLGDDREPSRLSAASAIEPALPPEAASRRAGWAISWPSSEASRPAVASYGRCRPK
jgi:hypothetical protein